LRYRHIEEYVKWDAKVGRYRSVETGRFVSLQSVAQTKGALRYWNSVRAIVRCAKDRTFAEAREMMKWWGEHEKELSRMEWEEEHSNIFGY